MDKEKKEFDATLGGSEHLPFSANSFKFTTSRSVEIAAMTESILRPSKTKLIFQTLPVHMRRRVMSHNCKRLPIRKRQGHMDQLKKSGLPPKQKRPSRKYRRRHANLVEEYNKRQKRVKWLETHIWHAKRFHMIERWGYRLAYAPCDKAFRACYRATSAHCLIQDISYHVPVLVTGTVEKIANTFSMITNRACGLSVTAKAYVTGNREGSISIYQPNQYPFKFIGKVSFIWEPSDTQNNKLWLFVHPSLKIELESVFSELLSPGEYRVPEKKKKLDTQNIEYKVMENTFNRFRLTGPNSQAILTKALKCVESLDKLKDDKWFQMCKQKNKLFLEDKHLLWKNIATTSSPAQLSPSMVLGLIVKDPRLSRPQKRAKAKLEIYNQTQTQHLTQVPCNASSSPIWNVNLHRCIKEKMLTNAQFIEHVTRTQLVPGEVCEEDSEMQNVPVVLVQRPGNAVSSGKLGYGCGWDIIMTPGYALPFWHSFIMLGARAGGVRETERTNLEQGILDFPPDSQAGKIEELRRAEEMKKKHFSLPPKKRMNYVKIGINSPFLCRWTILLKDWCDSDVTDFFVLRDRQLLSQLQDSLSGSRPIPELDNSKSCLIQVSVECLGTGNLHPNAIICLPDSENDSPIVEPVHEDPNYEERKQLRKERAKCRLQTKRAKKRLKEAGSLISDKFKEECKRRYIEREEKLKELWLPTNIKTVRHSCSKEVVGYVSSAAFNYTKAISCGIGYITYNSLKQIVKTKPKFVLVRNTTGKYYSKANIEIKH